MTKNEYQKYLKSKHWKDIKKRYKNSECEICWTIYELVLHHESYDNLYKEWPNDLRTLCSNCHKNIHDNSWNLYNKSLKNAFYNTQKEYEIYEENREHEELKKEMDRIESRKNYLKQERKRFKKARIILPIIWIIILFILIKVSLFDSLFLNILIAFVFSWIIYEILQKYINYLK